MNTETTPAETPENDLDAFAADFFGRKDGAPETTNSEKVDDVPDDPDASIETQSDEASQETDEADIEDDDTLAPEDDAEEKDNKPAPKKNRLQERIDQLVREREEEKRERVAIQSRLDELTSKQTPPVETPKVSTDKPQPNALNEDGTDKYPLGEFDPNYLMDVVKHGLAQDQAAQDARREQEKIQETQDAAMAALSKDWNVKLATAQERYPDFQEKGQSLVDTFSGIDAGYGEYLTTTIMSMENGPDVLYYLANNVEEANKIVESGPTRATIALGRLEARFTKSDDEPPRPKVSKAPAPPPTNKGSAIARGSVSVDTDDLDAFANLLFKKTRA